MALLLFFLFLALGISFLCSLLESVILSVSHAYIALLVKDGRRSGRMLKKMKETIDHPLAAILTLNTLANVVGAAGVGAQTYSLLGSKWVAVSSALLTVCILVFSEVIPKTIGTGHWKTVAPFSAYLLRGMILVLYPIVKALEAIAHIFSPDIVDTHITREEMIILAEIGENKGVFLKKEAQIIQNVLLLDTIKASDIFTPRSVIFAFQKDVTIKKIITDHPQIRFSRIPVYGDNMDDIKGVVFKDELIESYYSDSNNATVEKLIKPLYAVPDSKSIAELLDEFINRREHLFLVVDEYGGTAGIVTLENAIEVLLGIEIVDEMDSVENMRAFALERWKRRRKGLFSHENIG